MPSLCFCSSFNIREKKTALQLAEEEDNEDIIKILKRGHEVTTFLRDLHLEVYTKVHIRLEVFLKY